MNIDLDNKTIEKLQAVAALQNTSVSDLLRAYADEQETYWRELKEDTKTLEDMKNGDYITQDQMFSKLYRLAEQAETME